MPEKLLAPARHETSDVGPPFIWIGVPLVLVTVLALALLVLWLYPKALNDQGRRLALPKFPNPQLQPNPPRKHGAILCRGNATAEQHRLDRQGQGDGAHPDCDCDAQDRQGGHSRLADTAGEAAMKRPFAILLALSSLVLTAAAPPPDLRDFAYQQRPGNQLPSTPCFATTRAAVYGWAIFSSASRRSWHWVISTVRICAASCAPTCSMRSPSLA